MQTRASFAACPECVIVRQIVQASCWAVKTTNSPLPTNSLATSLCKVDWQHCLVQLRAKLLFKSKDENHSAWLEDSVCDLVSV